MLGYYLDCKMMFENIDVFICSDSLDERFLNFEAGVVGMVEDTEFRMAALAVKIKSSVGLLVELDTPIYQLAYLRRSFGHHLADGLGVAEPVAGNHGVVDMFFEVVNFEICDRGHASLSESRVGFVKSGLADECHAPFRRYFQGKAHACYA